MDQTFSPSPRLSKTQRPFRTGLNEPVRTASLYSLKKPLKQAQERINWTTFDKDMDKTKKKLEKKTTENCKLPKYFYNFPNFKQKLAN